MSQIYIDMDGVIVDFDEWFERNDMKPSDSYFWNEAQVERKPFEEMKGINAGIDMVREFEKMGLPYCFLTSTGGGRYHAEIAAQKIVWLRRHLLHMVPLIFCPGSGLKKIFASPDDVLIDDRESICDEWNKASGLAIRFTRENAKAVTRIARELMPEHA